jgi:hypothetical protein
VRRPFNVTALSSSPDSRLAFDKAEEFILSVDANAIEYVDASKERSTCATDGPSGSSNLNN